MRAVVLIFACVIGLAVGGSFSDEENPHKAADKEFLLKERQVLQLFYAVKQPHYREHYEEMKKYSIEQNLHLYTNAEKVKEFLQMYHYGTLPKYYTFSLFNDYMRKEAIALFDLFYFAKDFDTFYKSALWARYHMNEGTYLYALTVAVLHRKDTQGIILPAPYEVYPEYFVTSEVTQKVKYLKMQGGFLGAPTGTPSGIIRDKGYTVLISNYTGWFNYVNEEQKITYFTEDVGLNSYYYYFQMSYPFWLGGEEYGLSKDRRGELYFYTHWQLLARYYQERLTNGLGPIPTFSWREPIKAGFYPFMKHMNNQPFPVRDNYYRADKLVNAYDFEMVEYFENLIFEIIEQGYFKTPSGEEIFFETPQAIEFLGNFVQYNPDVYKKDSRQKYNTDYYEILARMVLGNSPKTTNKYYATPSALELYQTSLRDPAFWQLYRHFVNFFFLYKNKLHPYTKSELSFPGVKINSVKVEKLTTYFSYFDFDVSSAAFYTTEEIKEHITDRTFARQPRLNHKPFAVEIDVRSENEVESVVRIFFGPKYDSHGYPVDFEQNKYNFVEMDSFRYKLSVGDNKIVCNSRHFFRVSKDFTTFSSLYQAVDAAINGTESFKFDGRHLHNGFPNRLLLPKGTKDGFPFQFFVVISPVLPADAAYATNYDKYTYSGVGTGTRYLDSRAFGYPLDRPINSYFYQPNMYFADVSVYHSGEDFVPSFGYVSHFTDKTYYEN